MITDLTYLQAFKYAKKGFTVSRPDGYGPIKWGLIADGKNLTLCSAKDDHNPACLFHEDIIAEDWIATRTVAGDELLWRPKDEPQDDTDDSDTIIREAVKRGCPQAIIDLAQKEAGETMSHLPCWSAKMPDKSGRY